MGIAACLPRVPAHAAIVRRGDERRGVERRVAQRLGVHIPILLYWQAILLDAGNAPTDLV